MNEILIPSKSKPVKNATRNKKKSKDDIPESFLLLMDELCIDKKDKLVAGLK